MRICKPISDPPGPGGDWHQRWEGPDQGTICSWLRGIEKAREDPALAQKAISGELPLLPWKGGVEKRIKAKHKTGAMQYLAAWQGLRGEDLDIDLDTEIVLTCSRTGVPVTFTSDIKKLLAEGDGPQNDERTTTAGRAE